MDFQDLMAAIGVVINGLPQAILALDYGFAAFPTALGYVLGAVACLLLQSPLPISMQAETIVLAGTMGKDQRERLSIIFWAGLLMAVLGATGVLSSIVDFAGENVINGMMAGVGIILARIAVGGFKSQRGVTAVSFISAILVYFLMDQNLVWTVTLSVILSSLYANLRHIPIGGEIKAEEKKLTLVKPTFNWHILRGILAVACLTIGSNIAFGKITASLGTSAADVDQLTVYSGLADSISSLFGGGPVEAIISATGAAPHPVASGVLMMAIFAVIFLAGWVPKLGKYIPAESVYGFLFVLGVFVTLSGNGAAAFAGLEGSATLLGGVPLAVTAVTDPFLGLVSGILVKVVLGL